MPPSPISLPSIESRYRAAADLLDGYVHESRFLRRDQSPDHEIVWASDGFEAIFGCTVEQYNRRELWGGFYLPEDAEAAVLRAARLRRGETVEAELRMMREDEEIRWMYVKNRPIFDPVTSEVIGVLGVGQDITKRKLAEQRHRKSESILISAEQWQLEREIIDIANREQQRIAVDLHEGLGQELTGAALMLRSLADKTTSGFPDAAEPMQELIELINRAIHAVRTLAHGLAPVDLERGDLGAALFSLVARTGENHPINMKFRCRPAQAPALPAHVANHLYRIAQEAIFNAVRHSGASHLSISLTLGRSHLVLKIEDDGQGISHADAPLSGMGLRIMQYRARMIGAQVSVEPRAIGGTTVLCRRPKG